jgi:DNA-binding NarL/FixJ family response regulator
VNGNERTGFHPALIVDDEPAVQERLARLLTALTGTESSIALASSVAEARQQLGETYPALALVDIGLPDASGVELVSWLHANRPRTAVVVVSAYADATTVVAALQAGATGYLLKDRDDDELQLAMRSIQRGGAPIDPMVARHILATLPSTSVAGDEPDVATDATLTPRETGILQLVERGLGNRDIAEHTGLSRFTVEGYIKAIYRKLAVGSRTAAIFAARSRGLLP